MEDDSIDGVPLDDLLPPPTARQKRKEPNTILDAEDQLKNGMQTALQPQNKGFQMLMKMGYNPDKHHVEPLKIELRKGRGGLGKFEAQQAEEEERRLEEEETTAKKKKMAEDDAAAFQTRVRIQAANRRVTGQLFAMLNVAHQLMDSHRHEHPGPYDESEDTVLADLPPLLLNEVVKHGLEATEGGAAEIRELLANLSIPDKANHHHQLYHYLRFDFFYCFWCGCRYSTLQEMMENCPGESEEAHLAATMPTDADV